ncbi:DNA polymerase-4 [Litorimonas taeanensis]|uniref:DNA-directed DNA polymerase n=1 Tax=Litorimonas taeanensis TaxID=568099 RepID=A0A420WK14_9PROT|nr:type VI secretion protein ImpB [Litorimonas taeanensis]RKQ71348.1 DNA polymerase-4 [Litorimonas taeanensis]
MRSVANIESLYLDFDGFFASVEQQCNSLLRGRPVGVVAFEGATKPDHRGIYPGAMIACSKEAKAAGLTNVMKSQEAKERCPELILVAQKPDLYRRAQDALLNEIERVIPIDKRKSIDEITCIVDAGGQRDPESLAQAIKTRIRQAIGEQITCSIGMSANRMLSKIACKLDKPNGLTILHPHDLPGPLLSLSFDDIPGIGPGNIRRLYSAGIVNMTRLWESEPKQIRKLWGNVNGERLWYALHGYDVKAQPSKRGMFGHSRILPPDERAVPDVRAFSRILLTKAARRMRRDGFRAAGLYFTAALYNRTYRDSLSLPHVSDDQAILGALMKLWERAASVINECDRIYQIGVVLVDLYDVQERQLDLLHYDDSTRQRWEVLTRTTDDLNRRFGRTAISLGPWPMKAGSLAGGKISFTRIPAAEDFF